MGELLAYSIVSGIVLITMYPAYRILLAAENQPGYNRLILMMIYLISFTVFPIIWLVSHLTVGANPDFMMLTLNDIEMTVVPHEATGMNWGTILIWIYMAGMAVVTVKTIVTWMRILNIIRRGERHCTVGRNVIILTDDEGIAPFSWMNYVVIPRCDCTVASEAILIHEFHHIACRHWIDLLVAQMVCVINWFNPAAWIMRDELMLVHEYQADMAVIESGYNLRTYQLLLIKKAVGSRFPSLANSLNHSKLKKRITMMYKKKSGAGRKMKALALMPMLALALCATTVPALRAAVSTISSSNVALHKGSESSVNEQALNAKPSTDAVVVKIAEVMPEYPGGEGAMMRAMMSELRWPEDFTPKENYSGRVIVQFTVMSNGSIADATVRHSCGIAELDAEALRAVSVALSKERWTPGTVNGKPVDVAFVIPVHFKTK